MSFRFRRSIKIAPGVTINLGKTGVSTSLGPRGAKLTIGNGRRRITAGIPGTGMSWSETWKPEAQQSSEQDNEPRQALSLATIVVVGLFVLFLIALAIDRFAK